MALSKPGIENLYTTKPGIEYLYTTYVDNFRRVPARWVGYSYTIYQLLKLGSARRTDAQWEQTVEAVDPTALVATLIYVTAHAVFHMELAISDTVHELMEHCDTGVRNTYIAVAVSESLLWDVLASVVFPYVLGTVVYTVADGFLAIFLPGQHSHLQLRTTIAVSLAVLSVPTLGLLGDVTADECLRMITHDKFDLCPAPKPKTGFSFGSEFQLIPEGAVTRFRNFLNYWKP